MTSRAGITLSFEERSDAKDFSDSQMCPRAMVTHVQVMIQVRIRAWGALLNMHEMPIATGPSRGVSPRSRFRANEKEHSHAERDTQLARTATTPRRHAAALSCRAMGLILIWVIV